MGRLICLTLAFILVFTSFAYAEDKKATAEWRELTPENDVDTFCLAANSDSMYFLMCTIQAKTEIGGIIGLYLLDQIGGGRKELFLDDTSINLGISADILSGREKLKDKSILDTYKDAESYLIHCGWGSVPTPAGVSSDSILLYSAGFGYTLIDVQTGKTTLLECHYASLAPDGRVAVLKNQNQVSIYDPSKGEYSKFILNGLEDQRIQAMRLLTDGGMVCALRETDLHAVKIGEKKSFICLNSFAVYDQEGAVIEMIPLGTLSLGSEIDTLYYSEQAGTGIAFCKSTQVGNGVYIFRADSQTARILWLDSADAPYAREREISEVCNETGSITAEKPVVLCPLGISQDGQYALFFDGASGNLLQMELNTLKMRTILTDSDLRALYEQKGFDYKVMLTFYSLFWNGADILAGRTCPPGCVLRLDLGTGEVLAGSPAAVSPEVSADAEAIPEEIVGAWSGTGTPAGGGSAISLEITVNTDGTGEYTFKQAGYVESYPFTLKSGSELFSVNIPADNQLGITACEGTYTYAGGVLTLRITTTFSSGRQFEYIADCVKSAVSSGNGAEGESSGFLIDGNVLTRYAGENTSVTVPAGVLKIGGEAFKGTNVTTVVLPGDIEEIGTAAFEACTLLRELTLPDGLKVIGDFAFWDCESLEKLTVPSTVTKLGQAAFYNCTGLTELNLLAEITSLEYTMFYNCTSLTELYLPDTLRFIDGNAFVSCDNLRYLHIPEGVTEIDSSAIPEDLPQLIIVGVAGSYAQTFAAENNIPFETDAKTP